MFKGMNRGLPDITQFDFFVSYIEASYVLMSESAAFRFNSLSNSS